LFRIIFGYLSGTVLFLLAMKLKKNYENFSAVLLSGSMATMYFITYSANYYYEFIPLLPAFILMTIFTAVTVGAALRYDKEIIALFGLVGAYAVPFLLNDNSGRVEIMFSYMAIINAGILIISFKKYWKTLYYSAFFLTWLIFFVWYSTHYRNNDDFLQTVIFL